MPSPHGSPSHRSPRRHQGAGTWLRRGCTAQEVEDQQFMNRGFASHKSRHGKALQVERLSVRFRGMLLRARAASPQPQTSLGDTIPGPSLPANFPPQLFS